MRIPVQRNCLLDHQKENASNGYFAKTLLKSNKVPRAQWQQGVANQNESTWVNVSQREST